MAKVLQVCFLIFAGVLAVSAQCPTTIPRGGWNARTPRAVPVLPIRPAPFVVVHATQTAPCTTQTECSVIIRDIQTFQMEANGWPDISYHFLIGGDNNIYEGRGWGRLGQNVELFTNQAINVGFIGMFANSSPSDAQLALLNSLVDCGLSAGALATTVNAVAQCQVTRFISCEATQIFEWIGEHPRFTDSPTPV